MTAPYSADCEASKIRVNIHALYLGLPFESIGVSSPGCSRGFTDTNNQYR